MDGTDITKPEQTTVTVTLTPILQPNAPEPRVRLRAALKVLLRRFGLRCVSIVATDPSDAAAGQQCSGWPVRTAADIDQVLRDVREG